MNPPKTEASAAERRGRPQILVTGNAALLKLGIVDGLRIVSPRRFCEALHRREK
jgi:predicted nucleic acid-binding protein